MLGVQNVNLAYLSMEVRQIQKKIEKVLGKCPIINDTHINKVRAIQPYGRPPIAQQQGYQKFGLQQHQQKSKRKPYGEY